MRQKERLLHRGFKHRVQSLKRTRQASLLPAGQKRPDHIFGLPKNPSAAASCRCRLIALRSTSSSLFVVRPRREVAQRLAFSKVCHWPRPPSQHLPVGVLGGPCPFSTMQSTGWWLRCRIQDCARRSTPSTRDREASSSAYGAKISGCGEHRHRERHASSAAHAGRRSSARSIRAYERP